MMARLSGRPRKLVRASHVAVSGAWLGLVVTMLILGIGAAATGDTTLARVSYTLMSRIGGAIIPIAAVATLLSGVALSFTTPWGLLQHYWIVAKIVLAATVIVTGADLTTQWLDQAAAAAHASGATPTRSAAWLLVGGSVAHLLMLAAATVISVDKPWGKTRRGRRSAENVPRRPAPARHGGRESPTTSRPEPRPVAPRLQPRQQPQCAPRSPTFLKSARH